MYSSTVYLQQQIAKAIVVDSDSGDFFTYRYEMPYSQKMTINLGVDNVLLFEFFNQQEKPVNIHGSEFVFRLINSDRNKILLEKPIVVLNEQYGRVKVTITNDDLIGAIAQHAYYSISKKSGILNEAVFTDAKCSSRGSVEIVDSVFPDFIQSTPLSIPSIGMSSQPDYSNAGYNNWPGWSNPYYSGYQSMYSSGIVSNNNPEYFSDTFTPSNAVTTIQLDLTGYSGTIKVQGAQDYQAIWRNVTDSMTYLNKTGTIYINVIGWHHLLRLCFNNSIYASPLQPGIPATALALVDNGVITSIEIMSKGSGYIAPPLVSILGDGAGAVAEATIDSNGHVDSITLLNGGSGYWPMPLTSINARGVTAPPNRQGAIVLLGTGYASNILVR